MPRPAAEMLDQAVGDASRLVTVELFRQLVLAPGPVQVVGIEVGAPFGAASMHREQWQDQFRQLVLVPGRVRVAGMRGSRSAAALKCDLDRRTPRYFFFSVRASIHSPIVCNATGAMVSSMPAYSFDAPVTAVWNR